MSPDSAQTFTEDVKYNYLAEYVHYYVKWHRSRGFFFWKHEISTVPGRLKIEKSIIFFKFLLLSSYCFPSVKSCVEHVFAGFRAIRCRKRKFFVDLELKNSFFMEKSALCCLYLFHIWSDWVQFFCKRREIHLLYRISTF